MANYLYKSFAISDMVYSAGPQVLSTTVTGKYLVAGVNFPIVTYSNSFHNAAANNSLLQFNINNYLANSSPLFPKTICPAFEYLSKTGNGVVDLRSGNNGNPTTCPNRFYFLLVGGGGGGGGGGRDGPGGNTAGAARGGGGGGGGATYGKLLNYVSGQNTMSYSIGTGGTGGLRGYNPASPNTSYDGDPGVGGNGTGINYNGFTYWANGGLGGGAGQGGDYSGNLGVGGAGGYTTTTTGAPSLVASYDVITNGNTGDNAAPADYVVDSDADGGYASFPFKSNITGTYGLPNLGTNRGVGGAGGYGDHAPATVTGGPTAGTPGAAGLPGFAWVFFYYD
jgi:hypothetical protein